MDTDDKEVPKEVPSIFLLLFYLPMGFLPDRYFGRMKILVYS